MWLVTRNLPRESDLFDKAGKALFLCQKFEITCKNFHRLLVLTIGTQNKEFDFLSKDYFTASDKLLQLFLGNSIKGLSSLHGFSVNQDETEILREAKDSRNHICHEALMPLVNSNFFLSTELAAEDVIEDIHIKNLARGDYLVSKWSFEFQEQKSGSFFDEEKYVSEIQSWVS